MILLKIKSIILKRMEANSENEYKDLIKYINFLEPNFIDSKN